jgi:ubiquinone/menaquinone biosynthesis C-methylase UbiE
MGFYADRVLPHVIHWACGTNGVSEQRRRVVPLATGRVLEVGMGSGLNLPFYDRERVELVWGLEPSAGMRRKARPAIEASGIDVRLLDLPGEEIPLDDDSVDTVVLTYTLCSIADWYTALAQMRRVLKQDGTVVFCEHGLAPDESVRRWQRRLDPVWTVAAGGCHLNRPILEGLEQSGFEMQRVDTEYQGVPKSASYMYWGVCTPR